MTGIARGLLLACLLGCAGAAAQVEEAMPAIGQDPMAQRYQLGHGLVLGDSGFTLGGYGDLNYQDLLDPAPGQPDPQAALDNLSGILWWDGGGRWRFFSEVELEDSLIIDSHDVRTADAEVVVERLYVDYAARDAFKLRFGKFLTPVGRWNLIHAAPLTWTTSRPRITEATFPTNASGAMVYGVLPGLSEGIEYSIYGSIGEELFPEDALDTFREAIGARVSASPAPNLNVGLSYANFELEKSPDERRDLYGIDFLWARQRWELSGEFAIREANSSAGVSDEHGLYAQLVAPITAKLYGVARYERFRESGADRDLKLYLAGLNYRLIPAVVLKAEYLRATDNDFDVPDGALASVAVLF